jgi:hypothetical protein
MLDRIGDEVARATSIVRYAPGSKFSPHTHSGGEEFLVLEGVFQDEHGDFPAGSYIRNPPGSSHTPRSDPGCTIFVKLWQFDPADRKSVRVNLNQSIASPIADRPGVQRAPLFKDRREVVSAERWAPGTSVSLEPKGGLEVLVIAGSCELVDSEALSGAVLQERAWLRLPIGTPLHAKAGPEGCLAWFKSGHLRYVETPPS